MDEEFTDNQSFKKKIANTIKYYKTKCNNMQDEMHQLREALLHLSHLPSGMHIDLDQDVSFFSNVLSNEVDMVAIQRRMKSIVMIITLLLAEKQTKFKTLENVLDVNETLLDELDKPIISKKVNEKLKEFLQYLAIPDELQDKFVLLEDIIKQDLSNNLLIKAIEEIKNLVIDVFNIEQYHFKYFLEHVTSQLLNVNNYLKIASDNNRVSHEATEEMEQGIQATLQDIHDDIDMANSLEDLTENLEKNLHAIDTRIKSYKNTEHLRMQSYEQEIKLLQEKLVESEHQTQKMKDVLGAQIIELNMDSLTKIANRHYYDTYIDQSYRRWKYEGGDLVLAVADIDLFKQVNDQYGHLAGDKVLVKIASILQSSLRSHDFVARYGGEEFVIIFEQTSQNEAWEILERIRLEIEEFHFLYRGSRVDVTVSFGFASAQEGDDTNSLFMRADTALYQAKKEGRNCVIASAETVT